jgi:transcriptional regulator with XRE-family HTH domain
MKPQKQKIERQQFEKSGELLKKFRIERGLSQGELGKKIDRHAQFVSNWERGLCLPPHEKMSLLVLVLKLKPVQKIQLFNAISQDATDTLEEKYKGILG